MFTVKGNPILADEMDVLIELRDQLALNGIYRFETLRPITNHIQCNCPIHKNGQERKPSCGITTQDIKYQDRTVKSGTFHCLACGYTATLSETISTLFGYNDGGKFGDEWLMKNFTTISTEERHPLGLKFDKYDKKPTKPQIDYVTEEELDSYRYIHPYMYERRMTDDIIELFDIGYDANFTLTNANGYTSKYRCLTFPIKDEKGNVLFIARRSVDTKFFHYPKSVLKPVYGVYELRKCYGNELPKSVIICESMINALTCWSYGYPALALNGTGTPYQMKQLKNTGIRSFVLGLDPDSAGDKGRKKIHEYFGNSKLIYDLVIPKGKDINNLSKSEFESLPKTINGHTV